MTENSRETTFGQRRQDLGPAVKQEADAFIRELDTLEGADREQWIPYFLEAVEAELGYGWLVMIQYFIEQRRETESW